MSFINHLAALTLVIEGISIAHALELNAHRLAVFPLCSAAIEPLERQFLLSSGEILGAVRHVAGDERDQLLIELLSEEAMRTSAIEGEVLDRSSVQSSLRRQFGLATEGAPAKPREQGSPR